MDGGMDMQSDNVPQELTKKMEELEGELKKMNLLFKELKQQIIDNEDKAEKGKTLKSTGEAERDKGIEMQPNNIPQDSTYKMEELDGKLMKMEELVKELMQLNTDNKKRPKILIEAKEDMSKWCMEEGKKEVDDREIECLAQAHLKNPHLDDEILKWILWASETNSKKIDDARSEMQEVIGNLQILAQESFLKALKAPDTVKGREMQTQKSHFKRIMDAYHHFQLNMDDTNKMWQLYLVVDILQSLEFDVNNVKEMWGLHLATNFLQSLGLDMEEIPFLLKGVINRNGPRYTNELVFGREFARFAAVTDLEKYLKYWSCHLIRKKAGIIDRN
ncbi:hypothetical protein ACLB2K_030065 [Fragaria x ananassa]